MKCILILLTMAVLKSESGNSSRRLRDSKIHFDGPTSNDFFDIPMNCQNETICFDEPENMNEITTFLEDRFKDHRKQLGGPTIDVEEVLTNRFGMEEEYDPNIPGCRSRKILKQIQFVKDDKNEWWFVVKIPSKNYVQFVWVETCVKADTECITEDVATPSSLEIKTFCRQAYTSWQLVVVNAKKEFSKEIIRIPSCCKCMYSKIDEST